MSMTMNNMNPERTSVIICAMFKTNAYELQQSIQQCAFDNLLSIAQEIMDLPVLHLF